MSDTIWIIVCAIGIPAGLYACRRLLHPRVDEDPSGMTSEEIVEAMKPVDNPVTRAASHLGSFVQAVKDIDKKL